MAYIQWLATLWILSNNVLIVSSIFGDGDEVIDHGLYLDPPIESSALLLFFGTPDEGFNRLIALKKLSSEGPLYDFYFQPTPSSDRNSWDNPEYQTSMREEFNRDVVPMIKDEFAGIRSKALTIHLAGHGTNMLMNLEAPTGLKYFIGTITGLSSDTIAGMVVDSLAAVYNPEIKVVDVIISSCHSGACDQTLFLDKGSSLERKIQSEIARVPKPEIFDHRITHEGPISPHLRMVGPDVFKRLCIERIKSGMRMDVKVQMANGLLALKPLHLDNIIPGHPLSDNTVRDSIDGGIFGAKYYDHLYTFVSSSAYLFELSKSMADADKQINELLLKYDTRRYPFKTLILEQSYPTIPEMMNLASQYSSNNLFNLVRLAVTRTPQNDPFYMLRHVSLDNIKYGLDMRDAVQHQLRESFGKFQNAHDLFDLMTWHSNRKLWATSDATPEEWTALSRFFTNLDEQIKREQIDSARAAEILNNRLAKIEKQLQQQRAELIEAQETYKQFEISGITPDKNPRPVPGADRDVELPFAANSEAADDSTVSMSTAKKMMYDVLTKINRLRTEISKSSAKKTKIERQHQSERTRAKPSVDTSAVAPYLEQARLRAPEILAKTVELQNALRELKQGKIGQVRLLNAGDERGLKLAESLQKLADTFNENIGVEISELTQQQERRTFVDDVSVNLGACGSS